VCVNLRCKPPESRGPFEIFVRCNDAQNGCTMVNEVDVLQDA